MNATVLEAHGLRKRFGGVEALAGMSFTIERGEVVALIGPNGAGKTTCFNVIGGQLAPDDGQVLFGSRRIDGLAPHAIAHLGMARTFQVAATFASMTVRDNMAVALLARERADVSLRWSRYDDAVRAADTVLAKAGLEALAATHAASLAYGEVKRVELALALATAPSLWLMAEPTAGMAPDSRAALMRHALEAARRHDIAVVFTEHDMDVVFGFARRVIVMDYGRVIADGTPAAIRRDPEVQRVYLGSDSGGATP